MGIISKINNIGRTVIYGDVNPNDTNWMIIPSQAFIGNDLLIAGDLGSYMTAYGGNDTFVGGAGDDYIADNSSGTDNHPNDNVGNDTFLCGAGNDTVDCWGGGINFIGGDGNDYLKFNYNNSYDLIPLDSVDVISGDAGDDTIICLSRSATISAGDGNDVIQYGGGHGDISLGNGNDSITVGRIGSGGGAYAMNASIDCGAGNDEVNIDGGSSVVTPGAGNDKVAYWAVIKGGPASYTPGNMVVFSGKEAGYSVTRAGAAGYDLIVTDIDLSDGDDGTDRIVGVTNSGTADGFNYTDKLQGLELYFKGDHEVDLENLQVDLLSGGGWVENDGSYSYTGKIDIGRAGGDNPIEVNNATIVVNNGVATISGDFVEKIDSVPTPLFTTTMTMDLGSTEAVVNAAPSDIDIAGLSVTVGKMKLTTDGIGVSASFNIPDIAISGLGKITFDDLKLDSDGVHLDGSVALVNPSIQLAPSGDIKLFKTITAHSTGLTATYLVSNDTLSITGGVEVEHLPWLSENAKLGLSFTDPGLTLHDGAINASVTFSATDIELRGGISLDNASLTFDTNNNSIAAEASLTLPFFKKGEAGVSASLSFNWDPFTLDSASIDVDLPGNGIAIGTTGAFLTSIGGNIDHWSGPDPTVFGGDLSFNFLRKAMTIDLHGEYSTAGTLSGTVSGTLIDSRLVSFNTSCDIDLNKDAIDLSGKFDICGGEVLVTGKLSTDFAINDVSLSGTASWMGLSANSLLQYSNDQNASNDWVKVWAAVENPLYRSDSLFSIGPAQVVKGVEISLDPSLDALDRFSDFGAEGVPKIGSWLVDKPMDILVATSEWAAEVTDQTKVHTRVVAYTYDPDNMVNHHGAVKYTYTEAEYADHNIAVVADFDTATSKTVAIGNPEVGLVWDIEVFLVDGNSVAIPNALGTINYSATVPVDGGSLVLDSVTNQDNLVTVNYDAVDSNTGAKLYFFTDTNQSGFDGVFIGDSTSIQQNGQFVWNAQEQAAGNYYIYAVLADDTSAPVQVYLDSSITLTGPVAVTVAGMTDSADSLLGGAIADNIKGGFGDDTLTGGDGNDTIQGGLGDDVLIGGVGTNLLRGNGGDDTYEINSAADQVFEDVDGGNDTLETSFTYTLAGSSSSAKSGANIENLKFSGSLAINGTGSAQDNHLTGNAGINTLQGMAGNDTLDGAGGADKLLGGLGDDNYIVDLTAAAVLQDTITELTSQGQDTLQLRGASTNATAVTLTLAATLENLDASGTGSSKLNLTGNTTANTLTGNTAANILDGGVGVDTLIGGDGDDTYIVDLTTTNNHLQDVITESGTNIVGDTLKLRGALATAVTLDLAVGLENLDASATGVSKINLTGNTGNNALTGNAAINILTGDDGDDTLDGLGGADSLVGGNGSDTYVLDNAGDLINETGTGPQDKDRAKANFAIDLTQDKYAGIEDAELTGSVALNLKGDGGNNLLVGNIAANLLDGGTGADTLRGAAGSDTYIIDDAADVIEESGLTTDIDLVQVKIETADGTYTLSTNLEKATLLNSVAYNLTGNTLANTLTGNALANTLDGGTGKDTLIGGAGNDTYVVDNALDVITESLASGGTDTVQSSINWILGTNLENLTLTGTANTNGIGTTLANILTGNSGNNILNGLAGADTLIGGNGNDTYLIDIAGDSITEALNEGTDLVNVGIATAKETYTLGANLENATLINSVAFSLTGNTLANILTGNAAANTLTGESGNDTLDGKAGIDTLIGGAGNDTYVIDNALDIVTELGVDTADWIKASIAIDLNQTKYDGIENLELTGAVALNATGDEGNNLLTGNTAANILDGKGGADTLTGGLGGDTYIVDSIGDVINETSTLATEIDTVKTTLASYTLGNNLEKLINDSIGGNFTGNGNGLNNTLTGNTGNDTLNGGAGTDTLIGGAGDDTYIVNLKSVGIGTAMTVALEDTITETAVLNSGIDTVQLSGTFNLTKATTLTLGANLENLDAIGAINTKLNLTGNTSANTLTGNNQANILNGMEGNDQLLGGAGTDTLIGGIGKDTLTGGAGNDIFRFDTALNAATNVDTITDFTAGDKIQLENAIFIKLGAAGALSAANFVSGAAIDANDFILYDTATGNLSYDADGSGKGLAVQFATLVGVPVLSHSDFAIT